MSSDASQSLQISEIFASIQGEGTRAGLPCAFVRLAGCNLHCTWCDTRYAAEEPGRAMSVDAVLREVQGLGLSLVCITGGEPLLQPAVVPLAAELIKLGDTVLVETNGTLDIAPLPPEAVRVMDVKCPGSGECGKTLMGNLDALGAQDEVKFVVCDRADFDWAAEFVGKHALLGRCHVLFSPATAHPQTSLEVAPENAASARQLAQWILLSGLEVRLQLQLHKLLWPDRARGV